MRESSGDAVPPILNLFALGSYLVESNTPFAMFTTCDLSNPGAFHWGDLTQQKPHHAGKIVILADESSGVKASIRAWLFGLPMERLSWVVQRPGPLGAVEGHEGYDQAVVV
jgi:hypothetical protein